MLVSTSRRDNLRVTVKHQARDVVLRRHCGDGLQQLAVGKAKQMYHVPGAHGDGRFVWRKGNDGARLAAGEGERPIGNAFAVSIKTPVGPAIREGRLSGQPLARRGSHDRSLGPRCPS